LTWEISVAFIALLAHLNYCQISTSKI